MNQVVERHRVRQVLQRAGVAMLVTLDNCGGHHGRPLLPLWLQGDPNIYFLTHKDSRKVVQIGERPQVALTVSSAGRYFVNACRRPGTDILAVVEAVEDTPLRAGDERLDRGG